MAGDKYFVQFEVIDKPALITALNNGQLAFNWEYQLSANANLLTDNLQSRVNIPGVGTQTINFDVKKDIVQDQPSINVSKIASPSTYSIAGDQIIYTIEVTNNGNVILTNVEITDPLPGLSAITFASSSQNISEGTLLPGESATYTTTYTIKAADVTARSVANTATVSGAPTTGPNVTDTDRETVNYVAPDTPSLSLSKSASPKTYTAAGQVLKYTFRLFNNGNVTLMSVKIDDAKVGISGLERR